MSFFLFVKEIFRWEEEGNKTATEILCHQVQMDLPLLKISQKVFSLTSGSPKVAHPKNLESIQAVHCYMRSGI